MIYLGKILGNGTKIKLLFVLINNSKVSYMEKELAKESKSFISEVNRQIPDLVNAVVLQKAKTVFLSSPFIYRFLPFFIVRLKEYFLIAKF